MLIRLSLFLVWVILVSIPLIILHSNHWVPLYSGDVKAAQSASSYTVDSVSAFHYMAMGCPCSATVLRYLHSRGCSETHQETVVFVGEGPNRWQGRLESAGFAVVYMNADEVLQTYGIHGGPWLIWKCVAGSVLYSGGHRPGRNSEFADLEIAQRLLAGESVEPFPSFGCATSDWLRQQMDPIGIKNLMQP